MCCITKSPWNTKPDEEAVLLELVWRVILKVFKGFSAAGVLGRKFLDRNPSDITKPHETSQPQYGASMGLQWGEIGKNNLGDLWVFS